MTIRTRLRGLLAVMTGSSTAPLEPRKVRHAQARERARQTGAERWSDADRHLTADPDPRTDHSSGNTYVG